MIIIGHRHDAFTNTEKRRAKEIYAKRSKTKVGVEAVEGVYELRLKEWEAKRKTTLKGFQFDRQQSSL